MSSYPLNPLLFQAMEKLDLNLLRHSSFLSQVTPKALALWYPTFINYKCGPAMVEYLTIILRNRAEYHLILSRRGRRPSWLNQGIFRKIEQDNCFIIQQILVNYHFHNEKNCRAKKCPARASPGRPGLALPGPGRPGPARPGPAWPWPARTG